MSNDRQSVGRRGEEIAVEYLRQHGYRIHETNFRCPLGELDIIASERGTLVFVEVRTRRGVLNVEEMLPARKQRKVHLIASAYLQARYGGETLAEGRARRRPRPGEKDSSRPAEQPVRPARPGELPPCRIDVVIIELRADGAMQQIELIRDAIQEG